jgi:polysaccharide biosynthesis protein PelF
MIEVIDEDKYADVDVAIIAESTYPFLKGGVSAVMQDILEGNPDLTFGIIHITWDRNSPAEDLYGIPSNVLWIKTVYLSMQEHQADFIKLRPENLHMSSAERSELAHRLFDTLEAILAGDMQPAWQLYDEGMNPRTRRYPLSALLGSAEFMTALIERMPNIGLPLTDTFWLMREFFSLAHALLSENYPKARVYHAHTTGYASLLGAAAARQNDTSFLLTEHNLYVRDTVNTLLDRSMALPVTSQDWRQFDVTATQRAWMAWWIEMGHFCYPSADHITYLYPDAIAEAAQLGAPTDNVSVIPNGMTIEKFDRVYNLRLQAIEQILTGNEPRIWRLVYIARVVPIKGLLEFIQSAKILIDQGVTNWHLDVLGPTDHLPSYYEARKTKIDELGIGQYLTFRGTVNVRAMLGDFDILVLPSYNEGQPIVVLEAMTAGLPTVGTSVGGMSQLIGESLTTDTGVTWDSCGVLVDPDNIIEGMADALQNILADLNSYQQFANNARGRVEHFFQLHDAMRQYNTLYRQLGGLPAMTEHAGNSAENVSSPYPDNSQSKPLLLGHDIVFSRPSKSINIFADPASQPSSTHNPTPLPRSPYFSEDHS